MKYTTLPNTEIEVSKICLGTMTFGQQNTEAEGHEQMDYALEKELIFWDTAEMYSVPAREETYRDTERIIGTWFKKTGRREEVVLASKIAGPNPNFTYMREKNDFSPASIKYALDNSSDFKRITLICINYIGQSEKPIFLDKEVLKSRGRMGR
jgi:aryl-alcohol dehydrogenase-like predicted oxidoreductase